MAVATLLRALLLLQCLLGSDGVIRGAHREAAAIRKGAKATTGGPSDNKADVTLPRSGRVAILLRGEPFRCHVRSKKDRSKVPCCSDAVPAQLNATASLVENVIKPLEARRNKVEVVVTDGTCALTGKITNELDNKRVLSVRHFTGDTPNKAMRLSLDALKDSVPGYEENIPSYSLVLLMRHDTIWNMPIDQWREANFSKFNFASRCEEMSRLHNCNNDIFHTMPGKLFPAFDAEVGTKICWHDCGEFGHICTDQIQERFGESEVGFITSWRPKEVVRESNPIWSTYWPVDTLG